jgi:hypothetical protein
MMAFVFWGISCGLVVCSFGAHDLPDGVVKVSTQVVVGVNQTRVQYDVGFNPQTLDQLVEEMCPGTRADSGYKEKLAAFRKAFKSQVLKSLTVKVDNRLIEIQPVRVEPHEVAKHVQARFSLSWEIPISDTTRIKVTDISFQKQTCLYSAGFKAADSIAVKESSTKAIPIRSQPVTKKANRRDPFVITGTVVDLGNSDN